MNKKRIVIWYLFREYAGYNLLFTLLGVSLLVLYGAHSYPFSFWIKIVGYVGTAVVYYWSRKKHFYFFYNLGFNNWNLITYALFTDVTLTFIILSLTKILTY